MVNKSETKEPSEMREEVHLHAMNDHKYDQFVYGYWCLYGFGGPVNLGHAEYWLNKTANSGISEAQLTLGECYFDGQVLKKDLDKAKYWLIIAAANGEEGAKDYLEN